MVESFSAEVAGWKEAVLTVYVKASAEDVVRL